MRGTRHLIALLLLAFATDCFRPLNVFAADSLPELTSNSAVKSLSPTEAIRGYPVRIRGTITYIHPNSYSLFLQDSTAGI